MIRISDIGQPESIVIPPVVIPPAPAVTTEVSFRPMLPLSFRRGKLAPVVIVENEEAEEDIMQLIHNSRPEVIREFGQLKPPEIAPVVIAHTPKAEEEVIELAQRRGARIPTFVRRFNREDEVPFDYENDEISSVF